MCRKTERENWEHVIAVTNRKLTARPYMEQIERICLKRPEAVLVREKDLSEEEYGRLASEVYAICKRYEVPCIYHTFVQAAREAGAAAIHLPLPLLRKHGGKKGLPEFPVIGASVHSLEEAKEAELLGVSYLTAGHIYQTDCKKDLKSRGLVPVCQRTCLCHRRNTHGKRADGGSDAGRRGRRVCYVRGNAGVKQSVFGQ